MTSLASVLAVVFAVFTVAYVVFGHHFSSIAGGAVIVGPITAALAWGWVPAVLWIIIGCVIFGGLNDYASLIASVRHGGKTVGHLFEQYIDRRGKRYLLAIAAAANLLVIGSLSLVTAIIFDAYPSAATASIVYVVLALLFGLYWHRFDLPFIPGTVVFVAGMFGGILVGFEYPLILVADGTSTFLPIVVNPNVSAWLTVILLYGFGASVLPVWALLQPRDYLSSFLLYAGVIGSFAAIVVGTLFNTASAPLTFHIEPFSGIIAGDSGPLIPMLFPTIFCGAACGFHTMVCCGTTSKQLNKESDARAIGYGSTLAEGTLAVLAVGMVAIVPNIPNGSGIALALPTFATGGGIILSGIGVPSKVGGTFMALMLSVFSLTTVDTAIRLGRYLVNEAIDSRESMAARVIDRQSVNTSWQVILAYLLIASGSWTTLWPLFGATVQVFAGVALFVLGVWLARRHDALGRGMFLGSAFLLSTSIASLLYLGGVNVYRKLLDPSWLAGASVLETISVGIRGLVALLLVGLTARLLWLGYNRHSSSEEQDVDITSAGD